MRISMSLALCSLLLHITGSLAFGTQSILGFFYRSSSRLPTFINDLEHPWIEENRLALERLENPTDALCSLNSALRLGSDKLQYPSDLYERLEIRNSNSGRPGWKNAQERLREMLACPAALHDVEEFTTRIYISDGSYGSWMTFEFPTPPKEVPRLFVRALSAMPSLRKLDWDTYEFGNKEFKQVFLQSGLTLPYVRELAPSRTGVYMVDFCPGLEVLRSGGDIANSYFWWTSKGDPRMELINSTKALDNLTTFGMTGEWEARHLEALLEAKPAIRELEIHGEILRRAEEWSYNSEGRSFKKVIDCLARFEHLESLSLPNPGELGLGFDGGSWCGNAYFGPEGREDGRRVTQEAAETSERAAQMVLEKLPGLKALVIGGNKANISRNEVDMTLSWPWTEMGMRNWTYLAWPDVDPSDPDYWM